MKAHIENCFQENNVAIIIVNYATPNETIRCVNSFLQIKKTTLTIFLVDNASPDDSWKVLQQAYGHHDRVVLIKADENKGYTGGNNLGLRAACDDNFDYVLVVNPDTTVLYDEFISNLVEELERRPDVAAIGPRVHIHRAGNIQNTVLRFPWLHRRITDLLLRYVRPMPLRSGDVAKIAEVLNGVCVLFRGKALKEIGLFDENTFAYIEDVDWAYRAKVKNWKLLYLPVDSIVHWQKRTGYEAFGTVDYLLKRNTLYFLLKHRFWSQAFFYSFLVPLSAMLTIALRPTGLKKGFVWLTRIKATYLRMWLGAPADVMGSPYPRQAD